MSFHYENQFKVEALIPSKVKWKDVYNIKAAICKNFQVLVVAWEFPLLTMSTYSLQRLFIYLFLSFWESI